MALSKTVPGLIVLDECEDTTGWSLVGGCTGSLGWGVDTSNKVSGSGSMYLSMDTGGPGSGGAYLAKTFNVGSATGRIIHCWGKVSGWHLWNWILRCGITLGDGMGGNHGSQDWTRCDGVLDDSYTGNQEVHVCNFTVQGYESGGEWVDHLVICTSDVVTFAGFMGGELVKLYRASDNTLLGSATVAPGQTTISFNLATVATEIFPEGAYLKIYSTDGATLLHTTETVTICGGDTWTWTHGDITLPPGLTVTVDHPIIYRTGSGADEMNKMAVRMNQPAYPSNQVAIFKCNLCSFHSADSGPMRRHVAENHPTAKITCKLCDFADPDYGTMIEHMASKHPPTDFQKWPQTGRPPA